MLSRLFFFLIIPFIFSSCKKPSDRSCYKMTGDIINKIFPLGSFSKIDLGPYIQYELIQDTINFIEISAGKNLMNFISSDVEGGKLVIENNATAWTSDYTKGQEILIPLKNGEGSFQCDDQTLAQLEDEGRIVARYVGENPNGSRNLIAGITNERGNIVGLMPHPEHAIETLTGPSTDGLGFFTSVLKAMVK